MYKYTDNAQSNFLDFNQPIGLHMNPENRWVKMADAIPWEVFEKKYSRLFKGKNGRVAKPLRLALGSLIIQTKYQYYLQKQKNAALRRSEQRFVNSWHLSDEISDTSKISCRTVMHRHRKRALFC